MTEKESMLSRNKPVKGKENTVAVASLLFISAFALLLLLSVMSTSVCYKQFIPS